MVSGPDKGVARCEPSFDVQTPVARRGRTETPQTANRKRTEKFSASPAAPASASLFLRSSLADRQAYAERAHLHGEKGEQRRKRGGVSLSSRAKVAWGLLSVRAEGPACPRSRRRPTTCASVLVTSLVSRVGMGDEMETVHGCGCRCCVLEKELSPPSMLRAGAVAKILAFARATTTFCRTIAIGDIVRTEEFIVQIFEQDREIFCTHTHRVLVLPLVISMFASRLCGALRTRLVSSPGQQEKRSVSVWTLRGVLRVEVSFSFASKSFRREVASLRLYHHYEDMMIHSSDVPAFTRDSSTAFSFVASENTGFPGGISGVLHTE
ncbi:hypothetical protein LZ30DRAFT_23968 [Colletotrichum cereale]|nr:hypothetical protein LZ30DRAFT_23968 [Colletotrichum cereale]